MVCLAALRWGRGDGTLRPDSLCGNDKKSSTGQFKAFYGGAG